MNCMCSLKGTYLDKDTTGPALLVNQRHSKQEAF